MNYDKIRQTAHQFRALTSLNVEEFDSLLPIFEEVWDKFIHKFTLDGLPRLRKYTPKNEEQLPTIEHKLFFILAYQKNATTQEFFAASFGIPQDMCNKWIHLLSPLLDKSLTKYQPKKRIELVDFQENSDYLIDATERPIQRGTYSQKEEYSGKKKTHTLKNIAIASLLGTILFVSHTVGGKVHDKTLSEQENIHTKLNTKANLLADLAFLGFKPEGFNLVLPHKKPKGKELSEKQENTEKTKIRVKIEYIFAYVKIMRIVKDRNRNYKHGFRDLIFTTACALHNFRTEKK